MTFIVCEEYPMYRYHVREVHDDVHYGGFATPRTTLCGLELGGRGHSWTRHGWDTHLPLPSEPLSGGFCRACYEKWRAATNGS